MADEPADPSSYDDDDQPHEESQDSSENEQTYHGQIQHHQLSARLPEDVAPGALSNGVMILTGAFEVILDFVMRLGEQQRAAARVILPHVVARQFASALQDNIVSYEEYYGPLPKIPHPRQVPMPDDIPTEPAIQPQQKSTSGSEGVHEQRSSQEPPEPHIDDIYNELKMPEAMMGGRYANAVLIRHSATDFCFDFITNVYPRSIVSARVFMSAPHVAPFLKSLTISLMPPPKNPPIA
ncbi:DUF3467 domain-containing protein [Planctomicrobium sp. SH527]|uniref:DUF3467 domain-containing protein n=1 Tax=Planctomicrobium sp. SH527 TaxID=3448123 RepID=UPI003F5C989A